MWIQKHQHKILPLICGCISALAMAPASWWFVLPITVSGFYLSLSKAENSKQAFTIGWLFAFGYFLCSLSWIGSALLVEGNGYRWAYPLAISGIPFLLSFFWGIAAYIWHKIPAKKTLIKHLSFATLFSLAELARGTLFTGFPWNLFAYSLANQIEIIQIVDTISSYGLNAFVWLWASAPAILITKDIAFRSKALPLLLALTTLSSFYIYGQQKVASYKEQEYPINIKLVAGDIPQDQRWKRDKIFDNFMHYIKLSMNNDQQNDKPTLIVWPETALLDWYYNDAGLNGYIQEMLRSYPSGAVLITGALRSEAENTTQNSMVMIDQNGRVSNIYDKTHLVPFGEYIPFQDYIPLKPVNNFSGFTKGNGPTTLETPLGITYSPAVCYEIIFPYSLLPKEQKKPDFIINVTNDAWHEGTAGPDQHHAQVIFRAIEYKTSIIRVANLGISSIVDKLGRIKAGN